MFRLLILCGSLRAASSSNALARTLIERLPETIAATRFEIGRLPHYNADVTGDPAVAELIEAIGAADGVLFVTPEYNYSIPGVLKNAIDWASRPAYASAFKDKPCFAISVSGGALGGVRAQSHLKYILNGMLAQIFPWQEIIVPHANAKLVDGVFGDEAVLAFALAGIEAFANWKPAQNA